MSTMYRKNDHDTSIEAARVVAEFRTVLQQQIFEVLQVRPMTDGELENLPQFMSYGPSTVRKRRSELYQAGLIRESGERRGRFKVWAVVAEVLR